MRVVDYELFEVPYRWQFLKVETSDGSVGWGEPVVEGRAKTTASAVEELMDTYVVGESPLDIEGRWQEMYRGGFYRGGPVLMSAIAGIDQALWDLKGKHYGAPVYELLGGKARDRMRIYGHLRTKDGSSEAYAEAAAAQVDRGLTAVKTPPTDALRRIDTPAAVQRARERVGAIREAVGPDVDVALDFHGRVSKPMAKRLAEAVEPYEPMFIEEPVLSQHNDALPEIAAHTSIPIATGERMYSRWDFKEVFENGSVDVVQPDVSHAGGITETKKIADMAEAYDVAVAPHSPLGPVSLAASLHVDACSANALVQEQVFHLNDYYDEELEVRSYLDNPEMFDLDDDGYVDLPSGDGLGVEVNESYVREVEESDVYAFPLWRNDDGSVTEQ